MAGAGDGEQGIELTPNGNTFKVCCRARTSLRSCSWNHKSQPEEEASQTPKFAVHQGAGHAKLAQALQHETSQRTGHEEGEGRRKCIQVVQQYHVVHDVRHIVEDAQHAALASGGDGANVEPPPCRNSWA